MKKTFTSTKTFILSIICCLALAFGATAQQTKKKSLQGFLKDANGKAVADGSQEMIFKLYTQDAGGTAEWTESQTVNVFGGVYSTHLGKTEPLDNLNWGAKTYFVGVTVQGTELTPRTELTFAPYSLGSPKAQEVVCSGAVGDVKHSILNPTQFAAVNGVCWVAMDGRALVATDKLRQITGMTSLPDGGGLFIRSQEFSTSPNHDPDRTSATSIATFQDQAFLSHNHSYSLNASGNTSTNGNHSHSYYRVSGHNDVNDGGSDHSNPNNSGYDTQTGGSGDHSHSFNVSVTGNINNNGGTETRPKNLNLWVYIRIN